MKALMIAPPTPPAITRRCAVKASRADQATDNTDDDVADQPVATTFDHHAKKPTCNSANDQPNNERLGIIVLPISVSIKVNHPD